MGGSVLFVVCCTFVCLASYTSIAADTLTPNQNLTDGKTLVSSNRRFALGFFGFGNPVRKYLGIWYHNIPLTVVWVANKNRPLNDSFGLLTMGSNGSLFLYNSSMAIVWSTNQTVTGRSPVLQLFDTGNLVVKNGDDFVWQSFDHISNTLLPGMKLGWKLETRTNRYMTSWKSNEDPSDGDFTFSLDPPEAPQLIVRMGSTKNYRWGPFNGDRFSGSKQLRQNAIFKPMFNSTPDEVYYTYEMLDDFTLARFIVTQMGKIQYLTWRNHSQDWNMAIEVNRDYCDQYGKCGPHGTCYSDDPNCRCLKGFVPTSPDDWRAIVWGTGCKRRYELNCSNGDGFVKYTGLKLPDNALVLSNYSLAECRVECLKNCNCTAYTAINVHGTGRQCVVWHGDLIDLRNFPNDAEELYIRMAGAELDSIADAERKRLIRIVVSGIVSVTFLLLLFALLGWYFYRARKKRKEVEMCQQQPGYVFTAQDSNPHREHQDESQEDDLELPICDLAIIFAATDQFAFTNKIGQGGFGPVYKGKLPNGTEIAVKRLSQNSGQGLREFKNEVILIAKLQHRNLVRLLGCCIQGEERMLVYEYMPNKSLDIFLSDQYKRKLLPWDKRFNILLGIARGLLYLHQDSRLRIIHRDLKTSNILLDSEMNPKISDFGIARIFGGEQTEERTRRIIGTYGYMSPEYAMSGHFSVKSDVFSFGVIMLEIISGRKNWGFYHPEHDYNLIGHTWKLWNEENSLELVDEMMWGSYSEREVKRYIQVALLCLQNRAEERPTMSSVVFMLSNDSVELPLPKEPGFHTETFSAKNGSSCSAQDSSGINGITYTTVEGR